MKRELTYNEILNKITDAYFEVLSNDEKEVEEILKESKIDLDEFDKQTDVFINKLNRDIQIKVNKKKKKDLYERAKAMVKAIPNLEEYFRNLTEGDKNQFQIAFRNANKDMETNLNDFRQEYIILKLMEKLKKQIESREGKK